VFAVRANPSVDTVVAVGGNAPLVIDAGTLAPRTTLGGHPDIITGGGFIGETLFVMSCLNGTTYVWDLAKSRPILQFSNVRKAIVGTHQVTLLGRDGTHTWSPRTPEPDMSYLARLHSK
jgi:hypothetical protein